MAYRVSKQIEREMRAALRKEINRQGLIDTGLLYDSIEVYAEIDDFGVMEVTVDAMDYIKFLWVPYKLDQFIYSGNMVSRAYAGWLYERAKKYPLLDFGSNNFKATIVFNIPE